MGKKVALLVLSVFVASVSLLAPPPTPKGLPTRSLGNSGGSGKVVGGSGAAGISVDIEAQPAVNLLLAAKDAVASEKAAKLATAVTEIKTLVNTPNLSASGKSKIQDLIDTNGTANLNMIIGNNGGRNFSTELKADLNAILTKVSTWGQNKNDYAGQWGIVDGSSPANNSSVVNKKQSRGNFK
jgi:hypothetical protein